MIELKELNALDDTQNTVDCFGYTHCVISARALTKINQVIRAVNELQEKFGEIKINPDFNQEDIKYNTQDNHKIRSTNERLRKALDVAIETLRDVKNDPNTNDENTELLAYRLEQINEITKGK